MEEKLLWHHCLFQVHLSAQFWKAHNKKERCEEELAYMQLINLRLPESLQHFKDETYESLVVDCKWPQNKISADQTSQTGAVADSTAILPPGQEKT